MRMEILPITGENCITIEDGQTVYDKIYPQLKAGQEVELDFTGVKVFASPFFNAAVGQLLKDMDSPELRRLKMVGIPAFGIETLRKVIENSRQYYSSKKQKQIENAVDPEPH
jgi:hypothetical protein